ncbi:hypothetical protein K435DRAFT_259805 [Dendrothele bispora CBS 962.96]|uniref:Family A G protein-coupled receptor-like protein n=1 Tax=Dendrothele bispora (strain CBS 962.96) TaxID=1314807 RepID=A0A4V6T5R6_DENBC|nr:hypothetical protein K435DRAFT_259805 [Dendrothele bispora CBS 962.96]
MSNPITQAKLFLGGNDVLLFGYGVYFSITVICVHYLFTSRIRNWITIAYTFATLIVTTIFLVSSAKFTAVTLIDSAVDPLGTAKLIQRLDLLEQVVYSVKIWLADGLLIYRLWVVWFGRSIVTVPPSLLWIGSFATGMAGLLLFYHTEDAQIIRHLGVSFHACSVALNVIATSLIAGRLLYHRHIMKAIGDPDGGEHGQRYLSLLAVFAESGALYTVTAIVYIPLYAINSDFIFVWAAVLEVAAGIGPMLIVLRMALGTAVSQHGRYSKNSGNSSTALSTMEFGESPNLGNKTRTVELTSFAINPRNSFGMTSSGSHITGDTHERTKVERHPEVNAE